MRAAFSALALTTFALALAASATGSPSEPAQIAGCAKASLNLVEDGRLSLATDNPAFEPWWGGGSKSKDWEAQRPRTGKGYESAVAYGIARRLGFREGAGRLAGRPVPEVLRSREEVVRLLPGAGLEQAGAPQGRDLQRVVLHREPGGRGAEVEPDLEGALARRAEKVPSSERRWGRRATTTSSGTSSRTRPAGLRHGQRRRDRRQDEADRRNGSTSRAWGM